MATVSTKELAALSAHYCQTVLDVTGVECEVLRTMTGAYVAIFAPIGRTVTLSAGDKNTAYATIAALLDVAEHAQPTNQKETES